MSDSVDVAPAESATFTAWVDAGALLSYEMQLRLLDVVRADSAWNVDLAKCKLTFTLPRGKLTVGAQLLGSSALSPGSWLWGWANEHLPSAALSAARHVRALGETHGVPELTTSERPLGDAGNEAPDAFWYRATIAVAGRVPGADCFFRAEPQEGTVVPLLLSHRTLQLPRPELTRVVRVVTEGLASVRVSDHRAAIAGYTAARPGVELAWVDDAAVLTVAGGAVTVAFDEAGRVAQVSAAED